MGGREGGRRINRGGFRAGEIITVSSTEQSSSLVSFLQATTTKTLIINNGFNTEKPNRRKVLQVFETSFVTRLGQRSLRGDVLGLRLSDPHRRGHRKRTERGPRGSVPGPSPKQRRTTTAHRHLNKFQHEISDFLKK